MIVVPLIAAMAFQAGVNPPGGVWQDDDGHRAGDAIMAYNHKESYPYFLRFNTSGFIASLSTILLLISGLKFKNKATVWILMVTMWLAITSIATTYAFATLWLLLKRTRHHSVIVIVWSGVMSILLLTHTVNLVTIFVKEKRSRTKAIKRIMGFNPQNLLDYKKSWLSQRFINAGKSEINAGKSLPGVFPGVFGKRRDCRSRE